MCAVFFGDAIGRSQTFAELMTVGVRIGRRDCDVYFLIESDSERFITRLHCARESRLQTSSYHVDNLAVLVVRTVYGKIQTDGLRCS